MDTHRVISLRLARIAAGGPEAANETRQMVLEKVSALFEAQNASVGAIIAGKGWEAASKAAYAPYKRCVTANNRRLGSR